MNACCIQRSNYDRESLSSVLTIDSRVRIIREAFGLYKKSINVLDVGCGTGMVLAPFTQKHHIFGIDCSATALAQARKNGYQGTQVLDLNQDSLGEGDSFNAVLCSETIEHVVDTDWILSEINRVLMLGCHLHLTCPNIRTPISIAMMLLGLTPKFSARYRSAHVRDFTLRTIYMALSNSGFRVNYSLGCNSLRRFPSWSECIYLHSTKVRSVEYQSEKTIQHKLYS